MSNEENDDLAGSAVTGVAQIMASRAFRSFLIASLNATDSGGFFSGDSMILCGRTMGFLQDQRFMSSFRDSLARYENAAAKPQLEQLIWRKHVLSTTAKNCLALDGDFIECGVEYGFGVDVVSRYVDFGDVQKQWWLYDTFSGVPSEQIDPGTTPNPQIAYDKQYEAVVQKFSHLENVRVLKGSLPDAFDQGMPAKIAFLHIDMNNAYAEVATLIQLIDRVALGGHIILDDFGWTAFSRQHTSETALFDQLGLAITELPTGQGLVVKTCETNAAEIDPDKLLRDIAQEPAGLGAWPQKSGAPIDQSSAEEFSYALQYLGSQLEAAETLIDKSEDAVGRFLTKDEALMLELAKNFEVVETPDKTWKVKAADFVETSNYSMLRSLLQYHIDSTQKILDAHIIATSEQGGA